MDLSRQLKATGVAGSEKTTRYEVWREINAATDQYVRVPATDYQISEGRITFAAVMVRMLASSWR